MKLTTKKNRWVFRRELFLYLIPVILIVWTINVFVSFMRCSAHPEWSAPCSINLIIAAMYGILLILAIIFAVMSARMVRKMKKRIEEDFFASIKSKERKSDDIKQKDDERNLINKKYQKKEGIMKMIEENKHDEDDNFEKWVKSKTKKVKAKSTKTKRESVKKEIAKK